MLWNIGYNVVLTWLREPWLKHFCYADDTLILISSDTADEICRKASGVISNLSRTIAQLGLTLNHKKTQVLMFRRSNKHIPLMKIKLPEGCTIETTRRLKYLGVILDDRLKWSRHLKYIQSKALAIIARLVAIARHTFGYSNSATRIMLEGTVGAYLTYACAGGRTA